MNVLTEEEIIEQLRHELSAAEKALITVAEQNTRLKNLITELKKPLCCCCSRAVTHRRIELEIADDRQNGNEAAAETGCEAALEQNQPWGD